MEAMKDSERTITTKGSLEARPVSLSSIRVEQRHESEDFR